MADVIRIKRRASPGSVGAPTSLANAELAYNENDHTLYIGEGTGGGGGSATVIVPIGGSGMASNSIPIMDSVGAAGSGGTWSRNDHVHPTDTTRAPTATPVFTGSITLSDGRLSLPRGTTSAPSLNFTDSNTGFYSSGSGILNATVGAITRLTLNATNLTLTLPLVLPGSPTNPLEAATKQYVDSAVSGATAGVSSFNTRTGAVTLLLTDVTGVGGAPIASPTFTGIPAAPTPANGTNTTQLATTQFVIATRLDQFSSPTADVSWNSRKITSLLDPTNAQDAATKSYVDTTVQGLDTKGSVRAASTANLTLSGAQTVDGVSLIANDRVLVKDQTTPSQNGIYTVAAGAWTRTTDTDTWNELVSAYTFVEQGTINGDNGFTCTVDPGGTIGTTAVTWTQFSGAGQVNAGAGLTKSGNTLDVGGTTARILVNADNIDIDPAYVGQTSITTLGTVGSGTWNATTIAVNKGGTGATTLTGYVKGSGTSPFTASATIPNTDITGLGTMATQNANAVAITGGTIDGITFDGGTF